MKSRYLIQKNGKAGDVRNQIIKSNITVLYDCAGSVFMEKTDNKSGPIWIYYEDAAKIWMDEAAGEYMEVSVDELQDGDVIMTGSIKYHFMYLDGKDDDGNQLVYSKNELNPEKWMIFSDEFIKYYTPLDEDGNEQSLKFYRHKGNTDISTLKDIQIGDESISGTTFIEKYVDKDGRISDENAAAALQSALSKNANDNESGNK